MKDGSGLFKLQARRYYSTQHIKSATLFTRQAYQIEEHYRISMNLTDEIVEDHRSYVTGAIFAVVSFLEATINEVFADAAEHPEGEIVAHMDASTKNALAALRNLKIPVDGKDSIFDKYSLLDKFQLALHLAKKDLFQKGQTPYQDIKPLIVIRNTLVHYQPLWERGYETKIDQQILHLRQINRFPLNPLLQERTQNFFPDLCLSHGCAAWAVEKSIEFVTLFSSRMGTTLLFDKNSPRLKMQP
jgi:hypothetical protein